MEPGNENFLLGLKKQTYEVKEVKFRAEAAEAMSLAARMTLMPSNRLPVTVYRDGSHWVCSFDCHPDPLKCVVAYGESPSQACANFDALWMGTAEVLEEPEEEF
jgi:hypothetical protein